MYKCKINKSYDSNNLTSSPIKCKYKPCKVFHRKDAKGKICGNNILITALIKIMCVIRQHIKF